MPVFRQLQARFTMCIYSLLLEFKRNSKRLGILNYSIITSIMALQLNIFVRVTQKISLLYENFD